MGGFLDRAARSALDRLAPPALGRSFRPLLGATWLSNLSDGIWQAAGPLLVLSQTNSAPLVALSVILQRLPWFAFALWTGVVADRVDRRVIAVAGNVVRVAIVGLLALTIVGGQFAVWTILAAIFLLATAETFTDVASAAMVPATVPSEHLGIANARISVGFHSLNHLMGPPFGALLFGLAMWVPSVTQGLLLLAAALLLQRVRIEAVERSASESVVQDLREGVSFLWNHPPVRTLAITILAFNVTWGATNAVQALYAVERLGLDARGFGLFLAMGAVGGLIGSASYGALEARFSLGGMMRVGLVLETLTHLVFALTTNGAVAFGAAFVFGLQASVWGTTARVVRQRAVPLDLQGRVGSAYMFCVHSGLVVGGLVAALIGGLFGVAAVYFYAFAGSAVMVIYFWPQFPKIAHADDAPRNGV